MADTAIPPAPTTQKQSFTEKMASLRPKSEAELKLAGQPAAPATPTATTTPAPPEPAKAATTPATPPTPATPATPSAPDPDDEIISGKRNPKSEDFRRMKSKRDELQKAYDDFKTKLENQDKEMGELRKRPVHNAELIGKLEKERDEYKSKHDAFIVQFTPEFQQKYDSQIADVVAALKSTISETDANKLADLMTLPNSEAKRKAILEITDSMDQFQTAEVVAANREIQRISQDRKNEIVKAQQTLTAIGTERKAQAEARQTAAAKAFDETFAQASEGDKAISVFQKREGDDEWNKGVEERAKVARAAYNGEFENDADRARGALWMAAAPGILASYKADVTAKDAEIATLKETVAKLQGATPGIATAPAAPQAGTQKSKTPFTDRMLQNSI